MKITSRRVAIFLLLVVLSVIFGFSFDAIATAIEKHKYPKPESIAPLIQENADRFGIPEAILWAVVRTESNFESSLTSDDGRIGLMQISPETFEWISADILGEELSEKDALYGPGTNLRYGSALLSHLYDRYGVWSAVFAAYRAGIETTDGWMSDKDCVNEQGVLVDIPDGSVAKYVKETEKAVEYYTSLYRKV